MLILNQNEAVLALNIDPHRDASTENRFHKAQLKANVGPRSLKTAFGAVSNDIVTEVVEGEETPMFRRSKKAGSTSRNHEGTKVSTREIAPTLFPYPEYSTTGNLSRISDLDHSMSVTVSKVARSKISETAKARSFHEQARKMEIDRSNKVLLSSMLRMEKDLHSIKQTLSTTVRTLGDVGLKPETLSTSFQTSMIRDRHHSTQNRKQTFKAINKENSRIFNRL